jgi:hypothetical protein
MIFNNAVAYGKPETCSLTFRFWGKKRLAYSTQYTFSDPVSIVVKCCLNIQLFIKCNRVISNF